LEKRIASDNAWGFGGAVAVDGQYALVGAKNSEAVYILDLPGGQAPSSGVPAVPVLLLSE